jgi:hypothetical protein
MLDFSPISRCLRFGVVATAIGVTVACAYNEGADDPASRKLNWFSYLNADDVREGCGPEASDRYRFIYNGVYFAPGNEQVRTYDIVAVPGSTGRHRVKVRVIGAVELNNVIIDDPIGTLFNDPRDLLAPGRGVIEHVTVGDSDLDALDRALAASGFFEPPPTGLRLRSEEFFWLAAACIRGKFVYNAYKWPSAEFENATFPDVLLSWDPTGIPVNPPKKLTNLDVYGEMTPQEGASQGFSITVGENGLVGIHTLF